MITLDKEQKRRNKYYIKWLKLKVYLDFNFWKISKKKYFRLYKKLQKLNKLKYEEMLRNLSK